VNDDKSLPFSRYGRGRVIKLGDKVRVRRLLAEVVFLAKHGGIVFRSEEPWPEHRFVKEQLFMCRGITFASVAVNGKYLSARAVRR
jgi:hypothetical protein